MNIGIHLFDLLLWLFGNHRGSSVSLREPQRASGVLELERADVAWSLSTRPEDLPAAVREAGGRSYRRLTMNGEDIEFSDGFTNLHTRAYEEILAGRGFALTDARPSIELVHYLRQVPISSAVRSHV